MRRLQPFAKLGLVTVAMLAISSAAHASIVFLPVMYQYGTSPSFYYGGSDPAVFARAERAVAAARLTDRTDVPQPLRTYTDALPFAPDASIYGYTASDARDDAYRAVPRYFRKADLLPTVASATPAATSPVGAGTIDIHASQGWPKTSGRVILIPPR